jgi:23S rRNA (cytosine1962-C5)-methyltransferase
VPALAGCEYNPGELQMRHRFFSSRLFGPMSSLTDALSIALDARQSWLDSLDETTAWRLFHGAMEGRPGLTVDRYGPVLLVQTFRDPLSTGDIAEIESFAALRLPDIAHVVWNHRGKTPASLHSISEAAAAEHTVTEHGLHFAFRARHRGIDPWLFLDFRAGRRAVREHASGGRVLNLFAYTCGAGVAAVRGGATLALNVDFAASALEVGRRNGALNGVTEAQNRTDQADVIPTLRQLAGLSIKGRGRRRKYPRYAQDSFDIVVLDPPTWARSPFGAVDPVRDYASLFKPCVLATVSGGAILATNHVSTVDRDAWVEGLRRCATKAGRPLRDVTIIRPDPDFPSPDDRAPLKMAWCTVA